MNARRACAVPTPVTDTLGGMAGGEVGGAGLGDEAGIRAAYRLHGGEVYRFLLRGLGDPAAAEDVTQETFLKAWRNADRFDPDLGSLRVWLFGIARNAMIDHARARDVRPWQDRASLREPGLLPEVVDVGDPDVADRVLDGWVVEEALRRLGDHHREALVQTHLRERPYDEVATELGIPVGTLRSRVFYGLKALRAAMDEMGVSL